MSFRRQLTSITILNRPVLVAENSYRISVQPCPDTPQLKSVWQQLESRAEANFFLSWHWISTWLEAYQPNAQLLCIKNAETIVGLGLLVKHRQYRYGLLKSEQLYLHQTGKPKEDQIWIEYNGLLHDQSQSDAITKAAFAHLSAQYSGWDECVLGAITQHQANLITASLNVYSDELWAANSYCVDLQLLRDNNRQYLDSLSANTRGQIRKSIREYQAIGELQLRPAASIEQAQAFFDQAAPIHQARWGSAAGESGFANPEFIRFHRLLINNNWAKGFVNLYQLTVNEEVLGFFYNFIYQGRVYFYLSALQESAQPKLKPGLVGHCLLIQHYIEQGLASYDFLGGDARYKKSLATVSGRLIQVRLQKKCWKYALENWAKKIKRTRISP